MNDDIIKTFGTKLIFYLYDKYTVIKCFSDFICLNIQSERFFIPVFELKNNNFNNLKLTGVMM